mgnify:CR=1 FL=1
MTTFQLLAPRKWRLLAAAWIVALASSLAVLFIGEVKRKQHHHHRLRH